VPEDAANGTCFPCGLPRGSKGCKWNRKRQRHSPSYSATLIARTCTSFLRLAVGTISMCPMTTFKSYRGKGGGASTAVHQRGHSDISGLRFFSRGANVWRVRVCSARKCRFVRGQCPTIGGC
jgi:hypothetical protein